MPEIDIRTLFYLFAAGNFFILLFFWVYIVINKAHLPVINVFIVTNLFSFIEWILFALRGQIPDFYSISLANVMLVFSLSYGMYVVIFINIRFRKKHFFLFNLIPIFLSLLFLSFLNADENTRVIVASFIITFIYLSGGFFLIRNISHTNMQKVAGIFSLILGSLFLFRAVYALLIEKDTRLFTGNFQAIPIMFLFLTSLSWAIVVLLILKEQDNKRISEDNIKLNDLNKSKDRFFSIIAHDLKNPIGAFIQLGQTLLEEGEDIAPEERQKIVDLIIDSSKRTYNLLENLLLWARSESGLLKVEKSDISLNDIVKNNLLLSSEHINQKKLKVEFFANGEIMAYGDYNMIDTVVRNLLTNAVKFTHENGKIVIDIKSTKDGFVELSVTDSGIGIEKNVLEKLFDIDSSFKSYGTNNEEGTGIGLKLCVEFIKKNDGEISVISEPSKGSTFFIQLPAKSEVVS